MISVRFGNIYSNSYLLFTNVAIVRRARGILANGREDVQNSNEQLPERQMDRPISTPPLGPQSRLSTQNA